MNPQMKKGLGFAKTGLKAAKGGQKALRLGKNLKKLPPLRKKAMEKAERKAMEKEGKRLSRLLGKQRRQRQRRVLCRNMKGLGRVASALKRRYY